MRSLTGPLALACLIACCSQVFGQLPPGGGGFGRPGMGGPGGFDPSNMANMIFDRASNGKSTLTISEYRSSRDPEASAKLAAWAARNGISSGQVTREQFAGFMKERFADMQANGGMRFGGPPIGGPTGATMSINSGPGGQAQMMPMNVPYGGGFPPFNPEEYAKNRFAELDADKNNFINDSELQSFLKGAVVDAILAVDTDKDGKVNLAEFTEFTKQQMASGVFPGMGGFLFPTPESERKVAVYRVGSLPKELPEWFGKLDIDKDGQVGLYEWKKGGNRTSEFRDLDENSDGLVTVDEALIPSRVAERRRLVQENPGLVGALPEGTLGPNQPQGGWGGSGWGGWRGDWGRSDRGGPPGGSPSDRDKEREKKRESKEMKTISSGPTSEKERGDRQGRGDRKSRGGPGGESPFDGKVGRVDGKGGRAGSGTGGPSGGATGSGGPVGIPPNPSGGGKKSPPGMRESKK